MEKNVVTEIDLEVKGSLIMNELAQKKIMVYNLLYSKEWSGILLYTHKNNFGSENYTVEVLDIIPMAKGTSSYTEHNWNSTYVDYLMGKGAHLMDIKGLCLGFIHSHHSMSAYFSHTDKDELLSNAPTHNVYVSLIVNNSFSYAAKAASMVNYTPSSLSVKNNSGKYVKVPQKSKLDLCAVMSLEVQYDSKLLEIVEYFESIKEPVVLTKMPFFGVSRNNPKGFQQQQHMLDPFEEDLRWDYLGDVDLGPEVEKNHKEMTKEDCFEILLALADYIEQDPKCDVREALQEAYYLYMGTRVPKYKSIANRMYSEWLRSKETILENIPTHVRKDYINSLKGLEYVNNF